MIIKSHIRGGFRSAAQYLKEQGKNEKTRLVEISDPSARNLDEAFQNMWAIASTTRCTKPLHHISINPMKGEFLTDKQLLAIVERCEEKYGYKMFHHQRVIVEHVKDGRQHFHVIWNRVSLVSGRAVWPGEHWNKSKQVCREMEKELGLKTPTPRRHKPQGAGGGTQQRQRPTATGGSLGRNRLPVRTTWHRIPDGSIRLIGNGIRLSEPAHTTGARQPMASKLPMPHIVKPKARRLCNPLPMRPQTQVSGWPLAAILDWKTWGKQDPRGFFKKWPELAN